MYQERKIIVFDIVDQNTEILNPESVVLKIAHKGKASFTYFDIGSLCYKLRRTKFSGEIKGIRELERNTEVVLSSKSESIVELVRAFIEYIRAGVITKSTSTVSGITKSFINFFRLYENNEDFESKIADFDGFLSIYRDYTDNLMHKVRLAPNNPLSITRGTAASKQRVIRSFLQYYFDRAEIDIIRYVPSIHRGVDNQNVVSSLETSKRDDFIKFSFALFNSLADGILSQCYAPIVLKLPVKGSEAAYVFLDPRNLSKVRLNADLSWPDFSGKDGDIVTQELWPDADHDLRRQIRLATNQAKAFRSLSHSTHALSKAYTLAQSAFIACFYAATGINPTTLSHLKVTTEHPTGLRGMRFSGLKARAGHATVYPEFGSFFLPTFNKFKKLRTYVTNLFGENELWFFRPLSQLKMLDADSTLLPLKQFIKAKNFDVPILNPTQIRKGLSIDFLRLSQGDLVITSKKLGNSVQTVASNYTANSPVEQSREFLDFYQKMFESALERVRPGGQSVGVLEAKESDAKTPAGHCSNKQNNVPNRIPAFSELSPRPDCLNPETCLFCEHYSIFFDKEDIRKILGLKKLIEFIRGNVGFSDKYINFFLPILYRIDEIVQFAIDASPVSASIVTEVNQEIERGNIHPFWSAHYDFLIDLSSVS